MTKFGQFATFETLDDKSEELRRILLDASKIVSTAKGCNQYIVCKNNAEKNKVHVFEVWETKEDHDRSLILPGVKELISKALPLLAKEPESILLKTLSKITGEYLSFSTIKAFEKWISKNHVSSSGIWIRFFKKDSGEKTITHSDALDIALCYGWIDGQAKKFDGRSWLQRFTPRRPNSIWSKKNIEHVKKLAKEGKMKPAGLKEVERAKLDGRWKRAYDSPSKMVIPKDFLKELSKNKEAKAFFDTLNRANKYSIAWRLQTAKKPETRKRRMEKILEMMGKGEKFNG